MVGEEGQAIQHHRHHRQARLDTATATAATVVAAATAAAAAAARCCCDCLCCTVPRALGLCVRRAAPTHTEPDDPYGLSSRVSVRRLSGDPLDILCE